MLSLNAKAALAECLDAVLVTLAHGNEQAHLVERGMQKWARSKEKRRGLRQR